MITFATLMSRAALDDALAIALAQSLETMAFICAEPRADDVPGLPGEPCRVAVEFAGNGVAGRFEIDATLPLGEQIAATLADEGEAPAPRRDHDALKELANVTCGLFLRMLSSDQRPAAFLLRVPTLTLGGPEAGDPAAPAAAISFLADGHPIAARLLLAPAARMTEAA